MRLRTSTLCFAALWCIALYSLPVTADDVEQNIPTELVEGGGLEMGAPDQFGSVGGGDWEEDEGQRESDHGENDSEDNIDEEDGSGEGEGLSSEILNVMFGGSGITEYSVSFSAPYGFKDKILWGPSDPSNCGELSGVLDLASTELPLNSGCQYLVAIASEGSGKADVLERILEESLELLKGDSDDDDDDDDMSDLVVGKLLFKDAIRDAASPMTLAFCHTRNYPCIALVSPPGWEKPCRLKEVLMKSEFNAGQAVEYRGSVTGVRVAKWVQGMRRNVCPKFLMTAPKKSDDPWESMQTPVNRGNAPEAVLIVSVPKAVVKNAVKAGADGALAAVFEELGPVGGEHLRSALNAWLTRVMSIRGLGVNHRLVITGASLEVRGGPIWFAPSLPSLPRMSLVMWTPESFGRGAMCAEFVYELANQSCLDWMVSSGLMLSQMIPELTPSELSALRDAKLVRDGLALAPVYTQGKSLSHLNAELFSLKADGPGMAVEEGGVVTMWVNMERYGGIIAGAVGEQRAALEGTGLVYFSLMDGNDDLWTTAADKGEWADWIRAVHNGEGDDNHHRWTRRGPMPVGTVGWDHVKEAISTNQREEGTVMVIVRQGGCGFCQAMETMVRGRFDGYVVDGLSQGLGPLEAHPDLLDKTCDKYVAPVVALFRNDGATAISTGFKTLSELELLSKQSM